MCSPEKESGVVKRTRRRFRPDQFPSQPSSQPIRGNPLQQQGQRPGQRPNLQQSALPEPALQNLLAQAHTSQSQLTLIRQPVLPAAQRQAVVAQIGAAQGNRHLSSLIADHQIISNHTPGRAPEAVQRDDNNKGSQADDAPLSQVLLDALKTSLKIATINHYANNIAWIEGLEKDLINQIDAAYQAPNQEAAFIALLNKDKDDRKRVAEAQKTLPPKQRKKTHKLLEQVVATNPDLKAQWDQFGDQLVKKDAPPESLFELPAEGVSWEVGRTMARIDFMATMTSILGSVDAVKAHFTRVKWFTIGGDNMLLYEPAGQRLEMAEKEFEATYPGAQFPGTTVAQSLRGRHQHRQSLGLYAHPLGIAVDYYTPRGI